jgi:type II secretory pathway component PulJ
MNPRPRAGFSLVEALLSVALVAVVALIVFTLHRTVLAVRETQTGPATREESATRALLELGRDLSAGARVDEERLPFRLDSGPEGFSRLRFTVLARDPTEPDPFWSFPETVEYRVEPGAEPALQRISRPLSGPAAKGPFRTNTLVRGVAVFQIEALVGENFQPEAAPGPDDAWPRASQVRLGLQGDASAPRETVLEISLGLEVKNRLERR